MAASIISKTADDSPILKSGYLTKKGHVRHNWKKRWFVLQGNRLKYYDKPPAKPGDSKSMKGEITLHKGSLAIDSSTQKELMFTIQAASSDGEKKNYLIKAATAAEMHEWIDAIGIAGKGIAQGPPPPVAPRRPVPAEPSGAAADSEDGAPTMEGSSSDDPSVAAGEDELYRLKFRYNGHLSHANSLAEAKLANVHFTWSGLPTSVVLGAHDFVLSMRAPHFYEALVPSKKKKSHKGPVVIDLQRFDAPRFSPAGLGHFLYFVYTDELPGFRSGATSLQPAEIVRLLNAATVFQLPRCVALCQQAFMASCLTHDVAYIVLKESHDQGCAWAKTAAIDFFHRHIKEFLKNKEECKKLGLDLFQEVVSLTSDDYAPRHIEVSPIPENTLKADFRALYDRTLGGEGDTMVKMQMQIIRFHRALLSAHCKGFALMFANEKNVMLEDITPLLGSKVSSPDALRSLLKFIYYGDENVAPTHACEILSFAETMFMHDFQSICQDLISSSLSHSNVLTVLTMTYQDTTREEKEMMALREKALDFIALHVADLDFTHISLPMALDIITTWQKYAKAGVITMAQHKFPDNITISTRHSSSTFSRLSTSFHHENFHHEGEYHHDDYQYETTTDYHNLPNTSESH